MKIVDKWLNDLPQEFLCQKNIEVLIRAFSAQMQEVRKMFDDLREIVDLDTAVGENLDYVGTIIPLTRMEASASINSPTLVDDETYRLLLRIKQSKISTNCTYYDVIESLDKLIGKSPIYYYEPSTRPATIVIKIPELDLNKENEWIYNHRLVKAAGVSLLFEKYSDIKIYHSLFVGMPIQKHTVVNIY